MKSILLLHGWNDENYTSQTDSKDAWDNRKVFVDKLSKDYKIYKLNFPGFCGQEEPDKATRNSIFFSIGSFHIAGEPDMMVNKNKKDFSPSVEFGYSYTIFNPIIIIIIYNFCPFFC